MTHLPGRLSCRDKGKGPSITRPTTDRGSVLVQVLVMSMLLIIVATALLKVALYQATLGARTSNVTAAKKYNESLAGVVVSAWNLNSGAYSNPNCTSYDWGNGDWVCCSAIGVVSSPPCGSPQAGTCNCTCNVHAMSTSIANNPPLPAPIVPVPIQSNFDTSGTPSDCTLAPSSSWNY